MTNNPLSSFIEKSGVNESNDALENNPVVQEGVPQEQSIETAPVVAEEIAPVVTDNAPLSEEVAEPTNADFAKMRIANKEAKQKQEQLEKQLSEMQGYIKANQDRDTEYEKYQEQKRISEEQQRILDSEPDILDDPKAYTNWLKVQIKQEMQSDYSGRIEQLETQIRQNTQVSEFQELKGHLTTNEQQYSKIDSEYNNKKDYLVKSITNELKIQYPSATDAQIAEEIRQGEINIATQAWNNKQNPSKVFADLAVTRGYTTGTNNVQVTKKNQQRSVSMVGKTGASVRTGSLGEEDFAQMSLADKMRNRANLYSYVTQE